MQVDFHISGCSFGVMVGLLSALPALPRRVVFAANCRRLLITRSLEREMKRQNVNAMLLSLLFVVGCGVSRNRDEIASSYGIHADIAPVTERDGPRYRDAKYRAEVGVWRESAQGKREWIHVETHWLGEEEGKHPLFDMSFGPPGEYDATGELILFRTNGALRATVYASAERNGERVWSSQTNVDVE